MSFSLDVGTNESLRKTLDKFYSSLQHGGSALTSFLGSLSSFTTSVRANHNKLPKETLIAVHDLTSVVETVASGILKLEAETDNLYNETMTDISRILDEKMGSLAISNEPTQRRSKDFPAYIKPSYEWLLLNLHNPYPSKEMKKSIALQTRCAVKDIDAWFIDMRKRIGWNNLRKTKFSNKQEKIIAAATHFFKPKPTAFSDDLSTTLISEMDPNDVYRGDFATLANDAKRLYADRFPELTSFTNVDNVEPLGTPKKQQGNFKSITWSLQTIGSNVINSYPTPEPSPPSYSPEESLPSSPIPMPAAPQTTSRKRRQSLLDTCESDSGYVLARPSKRIRSINQTIDASPIAILPSPIETSNLLDVTGEDDALSLSTIDTIAVASLPSPSNSIDLADETLEDSSFESLVVPEHLTVSTTLSLKRKRRLSDGERREPTKHPHISRIPAVVIEGTPVVPEMSRLKCKRRLSDGESQCPPKRPHNAFAIPRLQTVSNPLPVTKPSFPDLFETWTQDNDDSELDLSDIPLPATSEDPLSLTVPLDIFNGQYDISAVYLDPSPEQSYFYHETAEFSVPTSSSPSSKPFADFVASPYIPEYLRNSVFDVAVGTAALPEFDGSISEPAYDLSFSTQCMSFSDNSQQSPPVSEWSAYLQSGNSYNSLQSLAPISVTTANLSDTTPRALPDPNSSDAKRAKIQALNEQIRLLEAEL